MHIDQATGKQIPFQSGCYVCESLKESGKISQPTFPDEPAEQQLKNVVDDRLAELALREGELIQRENALGERQAEINEMEDQLAFAVPENSIAYEAHKLVYGPRQSSYGHPNQDFKSTGRQWAALIDNWLKANGYAVVQSFSEQAANGDFTLEEWDDTDFPDLPPSLVALMMVNLKLSRESHAPKRDNRVDAIGYMLCNHRIEEGDDV